LRLPGQQDFIWGLGARISPGNFSRLVPTLDFSPQYQTDEIYSGFVQDEIPLVNDTFELTLGSKFEHNNYTGFEAQPSARLLWTPNRRNSFWISASRAVRTPSRLEESLELTDFLAAVPLIYLQITGSRSFFSERLIGYEAGYRALLTPKIYLDIAIFRNGYDDLYGYGRRRRRTRPLLHLRISISMSPSPTKRRVLRMALNSAPTGRSRRGGELWGRTPICI
jgi:iron complex outermembrane recepter protein